MAATTPALGADLVIAMPNWPSGQAAANILKVAVAKEFGLEAEVQERGTLNAFVGLEDGSVDINPEVWRPNLDDLIRRYVDEKGAVVLTGRGTAAWQGLCATEAAAKLGIKDIADLSDTTKTAALDTDGDGRGEVWIGAPTWVSTGIERVRANSYGYAENVSLVEAEEDVAMAAVDAAVATDRPMVFYCYTPHHVFELHEITRLTEPAYDAAKWKIAPADDPLWVSKSSAPVAWGPAEFYIAYSTGFAQKRPAVAKFLEQVDFSTEEVTQMTYALQVERKAPLAYAEEWVKNHEARVDGWASQ
ncbi:amino acid-binding protein [Rhizobiaceae bacterium n13]|uniref:Amino acid-binding protein n=1 Tax=Ferirhizobium litorale TaxID=2927786 RepID=A0AAE3U1W0_9HYPH|nr:glycine betaine ABC transporter substrate-binding protein [Fererhizobium litorale]MDI7863625.1 amino acid-binding protein [Fererhizobium litorale]MDI7923454.1 amino acid-binding protein [Fererhizobium litorale]